MQSRTAAQLKGLFELCPLQMWIHISFSLTLIHLNRINRAVAQELIYIKPNLPRVNTPNFNFFYKKKVKLSLH